MDGCGKYNGKEEEKECECVCVYCCLPRCFVMVMRLLLLFLLQPAAPLVLLLNLPLACRAFQARTHSTMA